LTPDYAKARELNEKGAALGSADAMVALGIMYQYGRGVPQDLGKAREWYEKAAAKGNSYAIKWLQQSPIR
jgi:TPR repeat protein